MTTSALLALAASLVMVDPAPAANESAADVVTLSDGKAVSGELVKPSNPGMVGLYVRREWVREHLPDWAERWDATDLPLTRRAIAARRDRLDSWRREREAGGLVEGDRITPWIDRELARLKDESEAPRSPLLIARLARKDVRTVSRAGEAKTRLLRLGWLAGFPNPESMRAVDLKEALEGRAFDASAQAPVSIEHLLPPKVESDAVWQTRRAATEVSFDPDLRFIRHQGLVLPESAPGQPPGPNTAAAGLSALNALLGENPEDPLPSRLAEVARRGRVGALVTKLDVSPDFSSVTVEMTLWVRQKGERWSPAGSRSARVRPDDLGPNAGEDLAADPQIAQAFQVVEALGFGGAVAEVKQRGLAVGAATRKALGEARTLANADLAGLALPVLGTKPGKE